MKRLSPKPVTFKVLDEDRNMVSIRALFINAEKPLQIPVSFADITSAKRGSTVECILANEIARYAKEHPDEFPNGFVIAYVQRRAIYIVIKREHRKKVPNFPLAIRYMADVGSLLDAFDDKKITTTQFRKMFGDGTMLSLRVAKSRGGEEKPHARETRGRDVEPHRAHATKGAYRRAAKAGLLLPSANIKKKSVA